MLEKIKALLGSIRFWQLAVAAVAEIAAIVQPDGQVASVLHVVAGFLVSVAAVGTVDRAAEKLGK